MNVSVPLTLRRVAASCEPQAWFLLGPDARLWLQTISEWDVDHARLRLAVLPDSGSLGQPAGVVVTSELEGDLRRVAASAICQGYHCVRGRVWIPVDAELSPRISQTEADELFPVGYQYLWHPTMGMHPVATENLFTLVDLISWPRVPAAPWDAAEPGMAIVRHIRAIQVLMPDSLEQWLEEGGGDIGGADSLAELPPLPGEPRNDPVSNAIRSAGQQLAAGLGSFAKKLSQNLGQGQGASQVGSSSADGGDGWLRRLADWSAEQSANFQRKLDAARNQQLNRLMAMLDQDPDRGLRFAISLGDNAYRGVDNSSPWLGESSVNFDWGRLFGGGGQAAIWDLSINHRARLSQKYRDLAQRERNLGRFRRAAYIYAHLLGDMVAAASALKAGGHYREAAALYQHKLNRKRMAAACLAEGDFFEEAIALYLETSGFSEAGDLARRMEDEPSAVEYYEQAVAAARQKNDLLGAANIRMLKLDDLDGAVDLLQAAWPYSADAEKCLRTELQWLTQAGEVHRAVQRLERVRDMQVLGTKPTIQACQVFSKLACSSPRQEIVSAAREACTRIAARKLSAPSIEDRTLLLAMADMHQQDRLLRRDCHRYVDRRSETTEATKPEPKNRKRTQNACTLTHRLQLMPVAQWLQAVRVRDGIAAVGDDGHGLSITMSDFQGTDVACAYRMRGAVSEPGVLFTALPHGNEVFCRPLFRDGGDVTETGVDSRLSLSDGWHIHADAMSCCLDGDRLWTARFLAESGEVLVEAIGKQGPRRGWQFVWDDGTPMAVFPMHMHVRSDTVFAVAMQQLVMLRNAQVEKIELPGKATGICGSLPNSLPRVVVTFEEGAQLVYCGESFANRRIADGVESPVAEFTASGHLVVAGTRRLEIYQTRQQELHLLHAEDDNMGEHPIAVLRGHAPTDFIVVDASGVTRCFKIHAD